MSIRDADVLLPARGLIQVLGENQVGHGKLASIGSGKTAFGDAIHRCVFGVAGRKPEIKKFSTDRSGDTYVRVDGMLNDLPVAFEMGYKCSELSRSGEGLRFSIGEETVEREHIRITREELNKALGMTPALASWTVCLDGDRLKFDQLSQAEAVEILMSARREPPWTTFHERSKKVCSNFNASVQSDRGGLDRSRTTETQATEAHARAVTATENAKAMYLAAKDSHDAVVERLRTRQAKHQNFLSEAGTRKKEISSKIKELERAATAATAKLEVKRLGYVSQLAALGDEREPLLTARADARAAHRSALDALEALTEAPRSCPTCGAPTTPPSKTAVKERKAEADRLGADLQAIEDKLGRLTVEITAVREHQRLLTQKIAGTKPDGIEKLSVDYEELETAETEASSALRPVQEELRALAAGPDKSAYTRAQAVQHEREAAMKAAKKAVKDAAASLTESEMAARVGEYWKEAFSPVGIPNLILRESISPLNSWASQIASKLTGGAVRVEFSAERGLADGRDKSELIVKAINQHGAEDAEMGSKGEAGLINLIIAETLAAMGGIGARIGYRWYDEVINPFCASARRSFLANLAEQCVDRVAFVVDHHAEVEAYATGVLIARKTGSGTIISTE